MKHIPLMRWNLPGSLHYSSVKLVADPRWQAPQTRDFHRYCLPSVARQTALDFIWLFFIYRSVMSKTDVGVVPSTR
jgi:hypothetical protein